MMRQRRADRSTARSRASGRGGCIPGRWLVWTSAAVMLATGGTSVLSACPFCGAVGESLSQRRDRATCVAVGESAGEAVRDGAGLPEQAFVIHQAIRGPACGTLADRVTARVPAPVRGTALLFAAEEAAGAGQPAWSAMAADETVIGHVAAAPATALPAARRLAWFAPRLEHPEPAIAEDAFTEFGLAPFAAVQDSAAALDPEKLRGWIGDAGIDPRRRGFYGLALGVATAATGEPAARAAGVATLRKAIGEPADDFRAGYDGLLAGLLVAEGADGLDFIERCGLLGPTARAGDQRHLLAALRFAWENLHDAITPARIADATARLLASSAVAADAAVDLARYRAWDAVDAVAALWESCGRDDPLVRRAVAGYLVACPAAAARDHLARIRQREPQRLQAAVEAARFPAGR